MIGKIVTHYKILKKLGEGGMGEVYKAEDTKLKRTVALKFLPQYLTQNTEARERFIQEAQTASALDHPNICTIHEIDETEDGQTFIVMACYDGESLKDKIEKGPLELEEAVDIAIQVAQGLSKAHEKGIVHRDIKPANIIITPEGVPKIVDFGLAKLSGKTKITKSGTTVGTISYMSPEQSQGEKVDNRSDIWSVGVVLYEMICGKLPFQGEYDQAVMYNIMNEEPEPLTGLRTGVPMKLEEIINKLLAKEAGDRYQHIDELPVDMRAIAFKENRVQSKQSISAAQRVPKPIEIRSKFLYSLAIIIIALLAGIIGWSIKKQKHHEVLLVNRYSINLIESGQLSNYKFSNDLAFSPDCRNLVYVASDGQNKRLYLRSFDSYDTIALSGTVGANDPFFSPDGSWIGFIASGQLRKIRLDGTIPFGLAEVGTVEEGNPRGVDKIRPALKI
jgi:serine/threonine protein kinase